LPSDNLVDRGEGIGSIRPCRRHGPTRHRVHPGQRFQVPRPIDQPLRALALGTPEQGAHQPVEHIDGHVGQPSLLLDDERGEDGEATFGSQPGQVLCVHDPGFAGDDGVARLVNAPRPVRLDADAPHCRQMLDHPGHVGCGGCLRPVPQPCQAGAAVGFRHMEKGQQTPHLTLVQPLHQVGMGGGASPGAGGQAEALDHLRRGQHDAARPQLLHDGRGDGVAPISPAGDLEREAPQGAIVGMPKDAIPSAACNSTRCSRRVSSRRA
jgi:hypothetical protein